MRRRQRIQFDGSLLRKTSVALDSVVGVLSPASALKRAQYRFAYDVLSKHRTHTKRSGTWGFGDQQLDEHTQSELREIARDMSRNNPVIKGMLKTERDGVVGQSAKVQARSGDNKFDEDIEAAWKERMLLSRCDLTGRFNFNQLLRKAYLSYRRDGDFFCLFADDGIQPVEGEQVGTPWGKAQPEHYDIINGVAVSKQTKKIIGYYIGTPNKYGYIEADAWKNYPAEAVHHMFNPDRFSHSRGEPALTAAMEWIDKISGYIDAELVAAKVNACFSMFVSREAPFDMPDAYTSGVESGGTDPDTGERYEKISPGTVMYGQINEKATPIGQMRPGSQFGEFVSKMLAFVGRPIGMPLMLITLDYSGATFMNARIAYQQVQRIWENEQEDVVKPFVARAYKWFIDQLVKEDKKFDRPGKYSHETICTRWPYVDPLKEAMADAKQLENKTTNRTQICARQGLEFGEVVEKLKSEEDLLKEKGLVADDSTAKPNMEKNSSQ